MWKVHVRGIFQYLLDKESEVMNEDSLDSNVNEYIKTKNNKATLSSKWKIALGLQEVDNLTTSVYMEDLVKVNVKNEISLDKLENVLNKYYEKLNGSSVSLSIEFFKIWFTTSRIEKLSKVVKKINNK